MGAASFAQHSFTGGAWSKRMQGRGDRPDYRTALNVCLNSFPVETGAWVRRPGTALIATTRGGVPGRLIAFDFSEDTPSYTTEWTDGFVRFITGARLAVDTSNSITTISTGNPAVVTTPTAHNWNSDDEILFQNLGDVAVTLHGRTFRIIVTGADTFEIFDRRTLAAVDGSTLGWLDGTPAFAKRVLALSTPFTGASWKAIRSIQATGTWGTAAILLSAALPPFTLLVLTPPTPTQDATFNNGGPALADGPYLDPAPGVSVTYGANTGSVTFDFHGTLPGPGFVAADVGRLIRMFCEPADWESTATYTVLGTNVKWLGTYWTLIGTDGGGSEGQPSASTNWAPVTNVATWTWVQITAVNPPGEVVATIKGADIPAGYVINLVRIGLYGGVTGWPTCGTYHEGRLWLSGAVPNRIDACVVGGVALVPGGGNIDFAPTDQFGNVTDSSAISYVFDGPDANAIYWGEPDLQGIIWGTKAGEWLVQSPTTGGLTATNIAARRVTKIGCANIEPRRTDHTIVFVQKFQRALMEYFADVYSGKFSAPDVSEKFKHLTIGGIDEIAYQQELSPTIWMRVGGGLVGCTYKRDTLTTSTGPTIAAGHPHVLGSGRTIESIAVGSSANGSLDALLMVTFDATTQTRYIEQLTDILDEGATLAQAAYLDGALSPTNFVGNGAVPVDTGLTIFGLWLLNGFTVTAWLGGLDCGDFKVENGQIFVPYGDGISAGTGHGLFNGQFVGSFVTSAGLHMPAVIGFNYNSDAQIVRPNTPQESGARNGPALGKLRRLHHYALEVEGAGMGLSLGTSFDKLKPVLFKNLSGGAMAVNATFTGVYRGDVEDADTLDGMLCWRATRPYPVNVAAIAAFLDTKDQ